jgi:hypothetical protein
MAGERQERLRTYSVIEHWRVGKTFLIEARTAEEAKEIVQTSAFPEDCEDQAYAEPVRIEARWER